MKKKLYSGGDLFPRQLINDLGGVFVVSRCFGQKVIE
jgi:hypothetical protein